jgi:hypothetical protein
MLFYSPFLRIGGGYKMGVSGDEHKSVAMDHHGLVAAVCMDLKLAERIDAQLPKANDNRVVSAG